MIKALALAVLATLANLAVLFNFEINKFQYYLRKNNDYIIFIIIYCSNIKMLNINKKI